MKDGAGYLLNSVTLSALGYRVFVNCPTLYITAKDICWYSHTLCITLKDSCWSVTRSLSHYPTFTTKSSSLYHNVKYL